MGNAHHIKATRHYARLFNTLLEGNDYDFTDQCFAVGLLSTPIYGNLLYAP